MFHGDFQNAEELRVIIFTPQISNTQNITACQCHLHDIHCKHLVDSPCGQKPICSIDKHTWKILDEQFRSLSDILGI